MSNLQTGRHLVTVLMLVAGFGFFERALADPRLHEVAAATPHDALFSIAFDGRRGAAVGTFGTVLTTADGGETWSTEAELAEVALLHIAIAGDRRVAVGQQGTIFFDAGDGWHAAESNGGVRHRLLSVNVNARGQAIAVGGFGTLLRSEDGGRTWTLVDMSWLEGGSEGYTPHFYDVDIESDGVATVVGEFGLIMRSDDGGEHWKILRTGDRTLFALQRRDDGVAFAVGQDGAVLRSTDGGIEWTELESGTTANLLGVWSTDDGKVVIPAMRDMIVSRDLGETWQQVEAVDIVRNWYVAAAAPPGKANGVFVVGHSGRIIRVE